jgi:hypothetical protein
VRQDQFASPRPPVPAAWRSTFICRPYSAQRVPSCPGTKSTRLPSSSRTIGRALAAARGSPSSPSEICLDGQSKCVFAAVSGATPVSSPMWFERPTLRFSCRSPPGQDGDRHGVAASAWHPRLSSTGSRAVTPNKEGRRSLLTSLRGIFSVERGQLRHARGVNIGRPPVNGKQ